MKKDRIVRILRIIMPIVGIISAIVIAPLDLVPPLIAPLPDTVQAQVDDAVVNQGLDGIIVYVDQAGQPPAFYAAGWKDRAAQVPLTGSGTAPGVAEPRRRGARVFPGDRVDQNC